MVTPTENKAWEGQQDQKVMSTAGVLSDSNQDSWRYVQHHIFLQMAEILTELAAPEEMKARFRDEKV